MKCSSCGGRGRVAGSKQSNTPLTCWVCDGTGKTEDERIEKIIIQIYEILWGLVGNASNYSDILGKEMKKLKDTIWEAK